MAIRGETDSIANLTCEMGMMGLALGGVATLTGIVSGTTGLVYGVASRGIELLAKDFLSEFECRIPLIERFFMIALSLGGGVVMTSALGFPMSLGSAVLLSVAYLVMAVTINICCLVGAVAVITP